MQGKIKIKIRNKDNYNTCGQCSAEVRDINKKKEDKQVAGKSDVCKDQAPFISDLALPETPALACSKNDDVIKSKRAHVSMNVCKAACFSRRIR